MRERNIIREITGNYPKLGSLAPPKGHSKTVIKKINRLKQEIIQAKKHYNEFGRFNPDLLYFEKAVIKLQTYLDLLSCC